MSNVYNKEYSEINGIEYANRLDEKKKEINIK